MNDDIAEWLANAVLLDRVAVLVRHKTGRHVEPDEIYDILVDHAASVPSYIWIHLDSDDENRRATAHRRLAAKCAQVIQGQLRSQNGEPRFFLYRQMQIALARHGDFSIQTSHTGTWYARATVNPHRRDDAAFDHLRGKYFSWDSPREVVTPEALIHHRKSDFRTLAMFFADRVAERMGADLWIPLFALRDFVAENYDLTIVCPGPSAARVTFNEGIDTAPTLRPDDFLIIEETLQTVRRLLALHAFATETAINEWLHAELKNTPNLIQEVLNRIEDTERGVS
jgi:hypothetical protein